MRRMKSKTKIKNLHQGYLLQFCVLKKVKRKRREDIYNKKHFVFNIWNPPQSSLIVDHLCDYFTPPCLFPILGHLCGMLFVFLSSCLFTI
jgi:hypothetical protein